MYQTILAKVAKNERAPIGFYHVIKLDKYPSEFVYVYAGNLNQYEFIEASRTAYFILLEMDGNIQLPFISRLISPAPESLYSKAV